MQPIAVNETASTRPLQSRTMDWLQWLTLSLTLGTCAVLRFHCAACKSFWFDECFSVELARISWRNFLHLMWWREANMSMYYILLRGWLQFGQRPFFIRSLSIVISVVTLPAIYWLAKLLYDRRVALIATALLAVNAYSIRYAQEARSYALFLLLATLSSGCLISWLQAMCEELRPQFATSNSHVPRRWVYIGTAVLAVYSHLYALLLIAAHWIVLSRTRSWPAGKASQPVMRRTWSMIGVAVLPLLIFVTKTGAGPIRWIQRPGIRDLAEFLQHLSGGETWVLPVILGAACIAAILPVRQSLWSGGETWEVWRCQFLLVWLLFPVMLTVLLSLARPVFLPRYMIFCLPALLILAARGLAKLNRWLLSPMLVLVLLLGLQGTAFVYGHDLDNERDASGAATAFILDHSEPGDAILFHIAETRVPYEFFRSLRAGRNTASPDFTTPLGPEILFPRHESGLDYRDFTGKPALEFIRDAAPHYSRVWLMLMNNGPAERPDPTTQMMSQVLPEALPKIQRWHFKKVEVRLYSK
ncbi:MAG TPA: hypothetical protein VMS18_25425 [Candidatus Binatia bacterium]|nr:hypothetical protein [Candidatus Binatia bacterium]